MRQLRTEHDRDAKFSGGSSARLQAAAALISERGDRQAAPAIEGHPAVAYLGGRDAALRYLHSRWVIYFGVAVDEQLDAGPGSVVDAAWRAWEQTCRDQPGLARILTWYRDEPVVRAAESRHRRLLAQVSGGDGRTLPGLHSAGTPVSARSLAASG